MLNFVARYYFVPAPEKHCPGFFPPSEKRMSGSKVNLFFFQLPVFIEQTCGSIQLAMGKKQITFEPDIRFSLAGKPWTMLFWAGTK